MLYKYVPYVRKDILENGLIRFTQPGDFNDPFGLHPVFHLVSEAEIHALHEASEQEDGNNYNSLLTKFLQQRTQDLSIGIQRTIQSTIQGEGMFALCNNLIARSEYDSKYGILSLSENPNNLLMWANYADLHRGFILQFDENHEFFAPREFDDQTFKLTKLEYINERPIISYSSIKSPITYYRKSPQWAYETEWRLIRPLSEATKFIDLNSKFPIALFQIPFDAIKGIIIGVSVEHSKRVELFELLRRPDLEHIKIFQTRLSDDEYSLEIHPPLNGEYPPEALSGRVLGQSEGLRIIVSNVAK